MHLIKRFDEESLVDRQTAGQSQSNEYRRAENAAQIHGIHYKLRLEPWRKICLHLQEDFLLGAGMSCNWKVRRAAGPVF